MRHRMRQASAAGRKKAEEEEEERCRKTEEDFGEEDNMAAWSPESDVGP